MLTLRPIDLSNIWDIAELDVLPSQQNLVMTSTPSILESYAIEKSGGWAAPFGLYDGDTPVGFVMFTYNPDSDPFNPEPEKGTYEVNRFYIDCRYQGKGYGREGIRAAIDYVRTLPAGPASLCWIGYKYWNDTAGHLYKSAGFADIDLMHGDETVAVIPLP